jgi:hypothetical protein
MFRYASRPAGAGGAGPRAVSIKISIYDGHREIVLILEKTLVKYKKYYIILIKRAELLRGRARHPPIWQKGWFSL